MCLLATQQLLYKEGFSREVVEVFMTNVRRSTSAFLWLRGHMMAQEGKFFWVDVVNGHDGLLFKHVSIVRALWA